MRPHKIDQWTLAGAEGRALLGDAHIPDSPIGVVCIVHGFLGYKDYGMFPRVAASFADAGFVAHRFNLSHSGMTRNTDTFERADLFERDTWMKQVHDVSAVVDAVRVGQLAGRDLPIVLFGHSRGGLTSILSASRLNAEGRAVAGVITSATPSAACRMDEPSQKAVLERGFAEVVSNRTGQTLRIDAAWLREQLDDPAAHDVCAHAGRVGAPVLIVHGRDDATVSADDAKELAHAAGSDEPVIVPGGNHVFNTPNPMPDDAAPSPQLAMLLNVSIGFARACAGE